ncbi:MAG TPA: YraN family protein [Candidatus Sulfotelmatobacter sp.]|nr:YraN family protein [Candidatus Sulfotelmatobacter sp.]
MLARLMFSIVDFAARKGLAEASAVTDDKKQARQTGIRGETYAYWYLRRQGYIPVARNFRLPGMKGEIDIIGYDGPVLAFVEVKTRSAAGALPPQPEEAVDRDKRRNLTRMARQFLRARRIESSACRFDILAIETQPGARPAVRLHKGAFGMGRE